MASLKQFPLRMDSEKEYPFLEEMAKRLSVLVGEELGTTEAVRRVLRDKMLELGIELPEGAFRQKKEGRPKRKPRLRTRSRAAIA